jgi:hypothetical protein
MLSILHWRTFSCSDVASFTLWFTLGLRLHRTTDLSGNVLGQPAAGTYLTRCNPGETVAFDTSVDPVVGLTSTSAGVCCMWTFPGAAAVSAGPLARTGSCPNAKGELLDLSGMKINSIAASNFANIGDLK